jgi:hypothetical protein
MPQIIDTSKCKHTRKQLIAQDEEAEYWECLDCGELFEPSEFSSPQTKTAAPEKIDESLSDA